MKRRIRRIRRALKRADLYNAFHITLIAVLLAGFCVMLFNIKEQEQEKEPETTQAEVMQNPETMTQTAESIEDKYKVFDTMSEDWGSKRCRMHLQRTTTGKRCEGTFVEQRRVCLFVQYGNHAANERD